MAYGEDFRRKCLEIREKEGLRIIDIAKRFGVGTATITRWLKRVEIKRTRNKPPITIDMEALMRDIEEYPDAYQYERAERLGVGRGGIFHALKRLKVSYKKNPQASQGGHRKTLCFLPKDSRI